MKYVTISMIMAHTGKSRSAVIRALANAGVKGEKAKGVSGLRYPLAAANRFLARQWPEVGPMVEVPAAEGAAV